MICNPAMSPKTEAPNRRSTGFLLARYKSTSTRCPGEAPLASLSSSFASGVVLAAVSPEALPGHFLFSGLLLLCFPFTFGFSLFGCPLVIEFFYCTPKSSWLNLFSSGPSPCRPLRAIPRGGTAGGNAVDVLKIPALFSSKLF